MLKMIKKKLAHLSPRIKANILTKMIKISIINPFFRYREPPNTLLKANTGIIYVINDNKPDIKVDTYFNVNPPNVLIT